MENFSQKYRSLILFMLVYWFVCMLLFINTVSFLYLMLIWNTFLAILPLIFIYKCEKSRLFGKRSHYFIWTILWLLFFPNSVYMITDFIHISGDKFIWIVEAEKYSSDSGIIYSSDIMIWAKLLIIGVGFVFALFVGMESFYIFEQNIKAMTSKLVSFLAVLIVSLLSGIGVYIGRFLRFNSWDIFFNPVQLFRQVEINIFAISFIAAFATFVMGNYILYRVLRKEISS